MTTIRDSVDVAVPVRTAYDQWTQFESFPAFMAGVDQVHQITDTRTRWATKVAGVEREFHAEITERHPDERIAWTSIDGPNHAGMVSFDRLDDRTTRVTLQMAFAPEGVVEKAGAALGMITARAEGDLKRFKKFVESKAGR